MVTKKEKDKKELEEKGEIIIYKAKDGEAKLEVNLRDETVWLSLNQIAQLFRRDKSVVSRHIKHVFETKELEHGSTVAYFATVQKEGGRLIGRRIE